MFLRFSWEYPDYGRHEQKCPSTWKNKNADESQDNRYRMGGLRSRGCGLLSPLFRLLQCLHGGSIRAWRSPAEDERKQVPDSRHAAGGCTSAIYCAVTL